MKASRPFPCRMLAILALALVAASPGLARFGQEKNGPIICAEMEGRRSPAGGPECPWYTGSVVIGYGEPAGFRIPLAEDPDIFYDPYDVWDEIHYEWQVLDSFGQPAEVGAFGQNCGAHGGAGGRVWYTINMGCTPLKRGTYTVICTISDGRAIGDPARDDPVVKQMTMDVQCWFRINQVFSTDGGNTDGGSPKAGLVGVDVEWTAGYPPRLIASHMCDYLYSPQSVELYVTMSEERPPVFPHRGRYYFNSSVWFIGDWLHNSDDESEWIFTAGPRLYFNPNDWEETKDEQPFDLHNLSVEDAGAEYLIYDPETGSGNTITYKLKDAYDVCPAAQNTTVNLTINSSDGMFVRWESFTQTAGRDRQYTYVWDGKDWEGNQAPKGIYTYSITAYQLAQIPNPAVPGSYFIHQEWDGDKSLWGVGCDPPELVGYDETSDLATVRVGVVPDIGQEPPTGSQWALHDVKLQVFDPDTSPVTSHTFGDVPVDDRPYVDLALRIDKDGDYIFLPTGEDNLYLDRLPMNRTHARKPLFSVNARETFATAFCFYHGAGVVWNGMQDAWNRVKKRWVYSPTTGKKYKVVAGRQWKGQNAEQVPNVAYEHASVALSALDRGGRFNGQTIASQVWAIIGHGAGGAYESKAIVCHQPPSHKCAIAADAASVSGVSGWDFAYISDLGSLSSCRLAILAGCSSASKDATGSNTMGDIMRQKGVANTIGFSRPIAKSVANYWIKDFFLQLCKPFPNTVPLDSASIRNAAVESHKHACDWATVHHQETGEAFEEFLVLNGVDLINPKE